MFEVESFASGFSGACSCGIGIDETIVIPTEPVDACSDPHVLPENFQRPDSTTSPITPMCRPSDPAKNLPSGSCWGIVCMLAAAYRVVRLSDHADGQVGVLEYAHHLNNRVKLRLPVSL